MNMLLLGGGGREHALAWKMAQSPACKQLYIAPGNGGTRACGTNVPLPLNDFAAISAFVLEKNINSVLVGPEDPLVRGIHDHFLADPQLRRIPVIGPTRQGAMLEGSKDFSKAFMLRHGIPTAAYQSFSAPDLRAGCAFLETLKPPYVLKADGLAAGKGVLILDHVKEACLELESMLGGKFGQAGDKVVIEEYLHGIELSVFALVKGRDYCLLPEAKDYKRIGVGDTGPNTGGMGSVSGVPFADAAFMRKVEERIVQPTINGLADEGIPYTGFIFFGLMNCGGDPYVIEYNARMGDPETESVMPRLKTDLLRLFDAMAAGTLSKERPEADPRCVASVMMVSGGYPGSYEKGKIISGLEQVAESLVFHAGTRYDEASGKLLTDGGRVLTVTAYGADIPAALATAYRDLQHIRFEGAYFRSDIGHDL